MLVTSLGKRIRMNEEPDAFDWHSIFLQGACSVYWIKGFAVYFMLVHSLSVTDSCL